MILQSLYQLYDRLKDDPDYKIAPPGYSRQKISFKVVLTPAGDLFDIQEARTPVDGRLHPTQIIVLGSTKPSGSGLNPCLLWDNASYMLGYRAEDANPARTKESFEAFREKHLDLEDEIGSLAFSAVCRFLDRWDSDHVKAPSILGEIATGFGVFQIQGETAFVHEDPAVKNWWHQHAGSESAVDIGQCLVTGNEAPVARLHPKIKGVRGAQGGGATIVGFNEDAYQSYGKEQSYNAPVSESVAFQYVSALNAILDGPMRDKHRILVGDTTVAFWTGRRTVTEDIFASFASNGSAALEAREIQDEGLRQKLEAFLHALRKGQEAYTNLEDDAQGVDFFLLGLSPNAARISVRFFYRGTLTDLLGNLRRHYENIRLSPQLSSGRRKADPEFLPAWMLLRQSARDSKDIPPILAGPLLRAIISGAPYPQGLYQAVLRRIHADRVVNYPRACIIKGYLTRNRNQEVSMSLDKDRTDPAYRLGRLFAALEKTQSDALGKLGATIRDRFYSSASATPRSVFPRLLRTYQHHIAKLEGGFKINRERLVQEILDPLADFPAHLDLAGQGLFALGYYHQTRDFYRKRESSQSATETKQGSRR